VKLLKKLSFGLIVSSCLVLTFTKPTLADTVFNLEAAVNPANTLTLSNLSDEELLEYLKKVNDFSEILDSGVYIRQLETRYEDSVTDCVLGPNGLQVSFSNLPYKFVENPISGYGYRPYSNDVKSFIVFDDELSQWKIEHQNFRADNFELEEGEHITARREQDGILYLSTEMEYIGGFDGDFKEAQVEPIPYGTQMYFNSTFDIATGVLLTNQAFMKKNGQFVNADNRVYEYHSEMPKKDAVDALHEEVCGGKTHTIGIIVGQGTEREKYYVATANEDAFLDPWIRDKDRKYKFYLDSEFTVECPTNEYGYIPFDSDKIIYMK